LNYVERNAAELAHVTFFHQLCGTSDDATEPGISDKHVMRFFGEHELARARQRLEAGFRESGKLILAIAIGEHREGEEVEPVVARLIERFEDARLVGI